MAAALTVFRVFVSNEGKAAFGVPELEVLGADAAPEPAGDADVSEVGTDAEGVDPDVDGDPKVCEENRHYWKISRTYGSQLFAAGSPPKIQSARQLCCPSVRAKSREEGLALARANFRIFVRKCGTGLKNAQNHQETVKTAQIRRENGKRHIWRANSLNRTTSSTGSKLRSTVPKTKTKLRLRKFYTQPQQGIYVRFWIRVPQARGLSSGFGIRQNVNFGPFRQVLALAKWPKMTRIRQVWGLGSSPISRGPSSTSLHECQKSESAG
ncbi:hypothetical protein DFH07DRAFT_770555 [Mycena maculata]|uniref:Uncharacterized protein n=1 Tax=Mycena maculata TaxID=230809 RepID=A0AAD7JG38_9AGAR|nr:hypothetical protein DFH07DRAFT_770555 [Mycena maculata]